MFNNKNGLTSEELALYTAICDADLPALEGVEVWNMDSDSTTFLQQQLTFLQSRVVMEQYTPLQTMSLLPRDTDITIAGETSFKYVTQGEIGYAEIGDNAQYSLVNVTGKSTTQGISMSKVSYKVEKSEVQTAQRLGRNLQAEKARTAVNSLERTLDRTLFEGHEDSNIVGLNQADKLKIKVDSAVFDWSDLSKYTGKEIVAEVNRVLSLTMEDQDRRPDLWVVPSDTFVKLEMPYSELTGKSIKQVILEEGVIKDIKFNRRLKTAGAGGVERHMFFNTDADVCPKFVYEPVQTNAPIFGHASLEQSMDQYVGGAKVEQPDFQIYVDYAKA